MKINIIGNIFGVDGYSNHCRSLANALYDYEKDIRLDVPLIPNWQRTVNDAELNMLTKEPRRPDVSIAIMTPPFCKKFIGFLIWEGDVCPFYWLEYLYDKRVDMIFVPSNHTKQAVLNTLERNKDILNKEDIKNIKNKIRIVPHGYSSNLFFKIK